MGRKLRNSDDLYGKQENLFKYQTRFCLAFSCTLCTHQSSSLVGSQLKCPQVGSVPQPLSPRQGLLFVPRALSTISRNPGNGHSIPPALSHATHKCAFLVDLYIFIGKHSACKLQTSFRAVVTAEKSDGSRRARRYNTSSGFATV